MNQSHKNSSGKEKPLLLVAPLDWGLGHTIRMIPVIGHLLTLECRVVVACNSMQKAILIREFPEIPFAELGGYKISYGESRIETLGKLLLSLPDNLIKVKKEQMWFLRFLAQNKVSAVISDNRYGLRKAGFPSILITHQLNIHTGFGRIADVFASRFSRRMINKFSECWVPDFEGTPNLAGELSHVRRPLKVITRYLGALSRFNTCADQLNASPLLIILSGPEPQRTLFENIIISGLNKGEHHDTILVRGISEDKALLPEIPFTKVYNYADAKLLNTLVCAAGLIISRPGYTTVMDMVKLKKKMVVVPTPGQGEQEYLARHLVSAGIAVSMDQHDFSLHRAIQKAETFSYQFPIFNMEQYKSVLDNFIASLPSL